MTKSIEHLLQNSGLPGPRGNLELLHSFTKHASQTEVDECLSFFADDLHNSPEEFVVMCGVVGLCILNENDIENALLKIRKCASHSSWRIRESVAIGIQEIAENKMNEVILHLRNWLNGNELERRAVVAALCEPKLLKDALVITEVLEILDEITSGFESIAGKLSDEQTSLRKALGYGWSVVIVSLPEKGKLHLEKLATSESKHIKWIVRENLKKNRLIRMDKSWVEHMSGVVV